jgi:hypothetical protein
VTDQIFFDERHKLADRIYAVASVKRVRHLELLGTTTNTSENVTKIAKTILAVE